MQINNSPTVDLHILKKVYLWVNLDSVLIIYMMIIGWRSLNTAKNLKLQKFESCIHVHFISYIITFDSLNIPMHKFPNNLEDIIM